MSFGDSKLLNKINPKFFFLFSFLISSISMYLLLSVSSVLSTGKNCIMEGDMLEIYIPLIKNLVKNIYNHDCIYYSWSNSLGMDTSLYLSFYGGFNPFNIIFLLFDKFDYNVLVAIVIILKTGLVATSFQLFERKILGIEDFSSVIFSILYSLCSFQVSFNIINFIWIDALYVFPILCIFLKDLSNSFKSFIISAFLFSYIFAIQPYMGFVIGIASLIYYISARIIIYKRVVFLDFVKFACSGILGVLLSAFSWLPALLFLVNNYAKDSSSITQKTINPLALYSQLFFSNNSNMNSFLPNIYCGILVIILTTCFFLDKNIKKSFKILFGSLLFFFSISFLVKPINLFWHGFDAPDGWSNRFSWLVCFLLCTISSLEFKNIKKNSLLKLFVILIVNIFLYICQIIYDLYKYGRFGNNTPLFLLINICIFLIWIGCLIIYSKSAETSKKSIILLFILLACFEVIANGYFAYYKRQEDHPSTSIYAFYPYEKNLNNIIDSFKNDDFYRVCYFGDYIYNSDTYGGYKGISDFGTSENPNVRAFLRNIGFSTSPRVNSNNGLTDVSSMLLGAKYNVYGIVGNIISNDSGLPDYNIKQNDYYISLGFMSDENLINCVLENGNTFENNNRVISSMIGEDVKVFREIPDNLVFVNSNDIDFQYLNDQYCYSINTDSDDPFIEYIVNTNELSEQYIHELADSRNLKLIKYGVDSNELDSINIDEDNIYIYFCNDQSLIFDGSMIVLDERQNISGDDNLLSSSYIVKVPDYNGVKKVVLIPNMTIKQFIRDIYVSYLDYSSLNEVYNKLSENPYKIISYKNDFIKGEVQVNDGRRLLYTSIPYDKNWEVYVDGVKKEIIPLMNDSFSGVLIEQNGKHIVEFKYNLNRIYVSYILSALTLIATALCATVVLRKKQR